jgi:hypothetical protein
MTPTISSGYRNRISNVNLWIRGDSLNCRRSNLQILKHSQDKHDEDNKGRSQFKGVRYVPKGKRHWAASITVAGEYRHLGVSDTEIEAADARDQAAFEIWGECAMLYNPDESVQNWP